MKNIDYLLNRGSIPQYSEEEVYTILRTECELRGKNAQLVRCMEEFSELIEVIIASRIQGRIDYTHLLEEIADCRFCLEVIKILFEIKESEIDNCPDQRYESSRLLDNCVLNLTTSSIKISKCIRNKKNAELEIISIINLVNETIRNIEHFYRPSRQAINDIFNLKIKRSDERNQKMLVEKESKTEISTNQNENATSQLEVEIVASDEIEYSIGNI